MSTNLIIDELQSSWELLFPETPAPSTRQLALWIAAYGTEPVRTAIAKLARRRERASGESLYKYAEALMSRLCRQASFSSQPPMQNAPRNACTTRPQEGHTAL